MTFDDESDISSSDANISVSNGEVTLSSGTTGSIISNTRTAVNTITKCHLKLVGELLSTSTFQVSCNDQSSWTSIMPETLTNIAAVDQGNKLVIKINLDGASIVLKSLALLYS
jgi:hypothetical protein